MARRYAGYSNATSTASTTVPMFNIVNKSPGSTRLFIYDVVCGSDATPADAANKFSFRRTTERMNASTTVTPNALDPANPASLAFYDSAWTSNPTVTATSDVLQFAQNQRATFRWVAAPNSELVIAATTSAGLALMSVVTTAAANYAFTTLWEE